MVEAGTLAINADVIKKAGLYASAVSGADAYTNVFIKQAEGVLSSNAKYDFVTNYAGISTIGKEFLRDAVSSYAALMVINYDTTGYFKAVDYQVKYDYNYSIWAEAINLIRDKGYLQFIINGDTT